MTKPPNALLPGRAHCSVSAPPRWSRIRSFGLGALLASIFFSCAAAKDESDAAGLCPQPPRVDGVGRLREDCSEDAACPAGMSCVDADMPCTAGTTCACRPRYFGSTQTDQLVQGFRAIELDLRVIPGTPSQFSWTQPPGATRVVCGLFVADPEALGGSLGHIRNDSQALYRTHTFRVSPSPLQPQTVTFGIADLNTPHEPTPCEAESRLRPVEPAGKTYPIVTSLRVGCWASDSSGVIAATRLEDVSLTDIPEVNAPVSDCTNLSSEPDGRYCYPPLETGGCRKQQCVALPTMSAVSAAGTPPSAGDAGGAVGNDGGSIDTAAPVGNCTAQPDNVLCKRTPGFQFGRCIEGHCSPVTGSTANLDLPLVVATCTPQKDASAQTDWLNCFDRDVLGFGTCLAGDCRQRCLDASDCMTPFPEDPQPVYVCLKQDSVGNHVCSGDPAAATSALGLCVLAKEAACD